MEKTEYKSIKSLIEVFEPSDDYEICKVLENTIEYYSFGYDGRGKILVSSAAYEIINKHKDMYCYTTTDGYSCIQNILDYDYELGTYKENIPIYRKVDNGFEKVFTIEVDIIKVDDLCPINSIIGRAKLDTASLKFDITNVKIMQNLHDIKNQLMSMSALASYINAVTQKKEITKYVYHIKDVVYNCNYLINEISGNTHPKCNSSVNVHKILDYHISVVEMEKNIVIEYQFDADNDKVKGNYYTLSNAIQNILLNAVQAIETEGTIKICTRNQKDNVLISISDNGCGIEEENINKIFDNCFTTKSFGSGIGLYTSMQTVLQHKGKIDVQSEINKGTTFSILLPNCLN